MKALALAWFIVAIAGCGGSTTTNPGDASAPNDAASQGDATDGAAMDSATAPDSAADGGVVSQQSCAHSVACGTSGNSCAALDGGACGSSTTCYCQSYGQPRCLDLNGDAGGPGAPCTASNGCGPGLTCVQFGPDAFCFYCGD